MKITKGPMALLFAALVALMVTEVSAQEDGRPQGRFQRGPGGQGGRGPGGFGGGFGGFGRGGGGGVMGLLQIPQIREEIDLLPDQEEALKKVGEKRPRFERPEGLDFRDRSEENQAKLREAMEKMREQAEEFAKKANSELEEILFPEQMERLQQIEVQMAGIRAITMERVEKEVKITESQQKEIEEKFTSQREGMRDQFMKLRETAGNDREAFQKAFEDIRKKNEDEVMDVLSSEQKKKFEKMKGEPFEMPQRGGFGRGGQGGPGAGGRGGRGGQGGGPGAGGRGGRGGQGGPGGRGGRRGEESGEDA